jgi:hypothetical protein
LLEDHKFKEGFVEEVLQGSGLKNRRDMPRNGMGNRYKMTRHSQGTAGQKYFPQTNQSLHGW